MVRPRVRERVASELHEKLARLLLQEFADPELQWVTIHEVLLTPDMRHAYVIFGVLENTHDVASVQAALERVAGRLRGMLGKRMHLRRIPELHFIHEHHPKAVELHLRYGSRA